jgi:hypothetical protein
MQSLEHLVKEAVESVGRAVVRGARRVGSGELRPYLRQLGEDGCAFIEDFWPQERCRKAIEAIDRAIESPADTHKWVDDEQSDTRLYFAERVGGEPRAYFEDPFIKRLRLRYTGFDSGDSLLLAARMRYVPGNRGSGGGWHRDSPHRSQFKALLYLTDVTSSNGPFEFIAGSHRVVDSVGLLLRGLTKPNQYRFLDEEVARLVTGGARPISFCKPAGTVLLVDTKGIHRGRPIESGLRYAMTHYFWDRTMPADFANKRAPAG